MAKKKIYTKKQREAAWRRAHAKSRPQVKKMVARRKPSQTAAAVKQLQKAIGVMKRQLSKMERELRKIK